MYDSANKPKVRVLCLPDVDRVIGGVKQLYRHVEHLVSLGWDAAMVTESDDFRPSWFVSSAPSVSLQQAMLSGDFSVGNSILVLPETYLSANLGDFRGLDLSHLPRVIFNQNAYYSYGDYQSTVRSDICQFYDTPLVLQVMSISEDTHAFLSQNLGIEDCRLSRIINAIEDNFIPDLVKGNSFHWMPRKNPEHVHAVLQGIQRSDLRYTQSWQGEPLQNLSHTAVARKLNSAKIFLTFGHPEGFGLPIAEAMAAGCWVVGYSGLGGRELFRYGASNEVRFGDWHGFISAFQNVLESFALSPRETSLRIHRQSLAVRALHSIDQERLSIASAWDRIYIKFHEWRQFSD